ncbi:MAG: DsbA family oxidoreductase [Ardenticatenaceae bacterium]
METIPTIEIYSSIECPFAYLSLYRLRQVWPEYAGRVRVVWRALSLEYINRESTRKPLIEAELDVIRQHIEPELPVLAWPRPAWEWPVTMWPAFEALACAQAQGERAAFEMSWALRYGFFARGRSPSLRHEILAIAEEVARETELDVARLEEEWDSGHYKARVLADSRRGWHDLRVNGSATFVLPDGTQVTNPGLGELDFDEETFTLRGYEPPEEGALEVLQRLLGQRSSLSGSTM